MLEGEYMFLSSRLKSLKAAWILNLIRQIIAASRDTEHWVVATIYRGILLNKTIRAQIFDCNGIMSYWSNDGWKENVFFLSVAGNIPAKPIVTRSPFQTRRRKSLKNTTWVWCTLATLTLQSATSHDQLTFICVWSQLVQKGSPKGSQWQV